MARVTTEVLIDWDNDGLFTGTGENVSSRVRNSPGIKTSRGLNVARGVKPPIAGYFDAELDNQTGDYSTEKATSPLVGLLDPGRLLQARAAFLSDAFTRADAVTLGTADTGQTWTTVRGTLEIKTNKANVTAIDGGTGDALAVIDASHANCSAQVTLSTVQNTQYLIFRYQDASNWWAAEVRTGTSQVLIAKVEGAAYVVLASASVTWANGDILRVDLAADTIRVLVNGVQKTAYTSSTFSTATKYGVGKGNAAGTTNRFDDFAVYTAIFTGNLDDLPQYPEKQRLAVGIPALGTLTKLVGKSGYSTILYGDGTESGGIRTDQALGYLLDAIGLTDTTQRVFDTGQTTFLWWWLDYMEDPFEAAVAILNSEGPGAALYEDGQGRLVFRNRFHRALNAASSISQVTLRDSGSEPLLSQPFTYDRGLKRIVNSCTVTHKKRSLDAVGRIWDPGPDDLTLAGAEVRKLIVVDANGDPFKSAVTPVLGTDYLVTAGSVASMALDRTSGSSATLTITAGAGGATIRTLELRARAVRVAATTKLVNGTAATASIAKYGSRPYTLATRAECGVTQLQSLCDAVVALWQNPRPQATLTIENLNTTRILQFSRQISDRITASVAQVGLDTDMHIDQIGFEFGSGGRHVKMTLAAEKATDATRYFIIGTDTLGGVALLGY